MTSQKKSSLFGLEDYMMTDDHPHNNHRSIIALVGQLYVHSDVGRANQCLCRNEYLVVVVA